MTIEMIGSQIEKYIDQLLIVLDKDIEQIEQNIERLNTLRSLLIKQDKGDLEQLLKTIRSESTHCHQNEMNRQKLRSQLAGMFNCSPEKLTLSYLQERLTQNKKTEVAERRNALRKLTSVLKREYTATQMLLIDCARFNRMLLNNIFQTAQSGNLTYKSSGTTQRQMDTSLMDLQF